MKKYVLDTSAFIGGFVPSEGEFFTVEEVAGEARSILAKSRLEAGILSGSVKILSPSRRSLSKVKEVCRRTGNIISETDAKLLALAMDLGAELITDDYALQNAASILKIPARPITTEGIKETREWVEFCPSCGRVYEGGEKVCEVCGSPLSRRVERKRRL